MDLGEKSIAIDVIVAGFYLSCTEALASPSPSRLVNEPR